MGKILSAEEMQALRAKHAPKAEQPNAEEASKKVLSPAEMDRLRQMNQPSGYSGVPDEKLNTIQKAERWYVENVDPRLKGREYFSPEAIDNKLKTAPIAAVGAAATAFPGLLPAAAKWTATKAGVPFSLGAAGTLFGNAIWRRLTGKQPP